MWSLSGVLFTMSNFCAFLLQVEPDPKGMIDKGKILSSMTPVYVELPLLWTEKNRCELLFRVTFGQICES